MSCDVRQNAINTMKSENVIDEKRAITNKYKFSRLNEELTKNAEKFYNLDAKGEFMFTVIDPNRQADKYDRIAGYSNKTYYDLNDKLFDELQRLEDLQASAEVKLKDNSVVGKPDNLQYRYSFINIIQDNKSKIDKWSNQLKDIDKVFTKIQQDLQIPKDLLNLLKDSEGSTIDEKITNFISNYSYTVEVNTAKKKSLINQKGIELEQSGNRWVVLNHQTGIPKYFDSEKAAEEYIRKDVKDENSDYYSNLTVNEDFYKNNPDWEYKEQRITTPLITPSIKGHAQFAEVNDIGWFRAWYNKKTGEVHVLEVQSDLFQKGRDRARLATDKNEILNDSGTAHYEKQDDSFVVYMNDGSKIQETGEDNIWGFFDTEEEAKKEVLKLNTNDGSGTKANQFLQLLNKDNNWITFFIKSIIQDSAKKGYEKVLFPTGNTASKIEGHTTLEEFKKQKEDRIKQIQEEQKELVAAIKTPQYSAATRGYYIPGKGMDMSHGDKNAFIEIVSTQIAKYDNEINQLKQELERVETEGFGALKPIYNFYENTVTNILKKQGYNLVLITDEYGNTWNEVELNKNRDFKPISLLMSNNLNYLSSDEDIIEELIQEGKLKTKCD